MSSSEPTGLSHGYLLDGRGGGAPLDWAGIERWSPGDGALWLNLDYSIGDVEGWLETRSGIDPVVRDALLDSDPRPRAAAHGDALLLIVRGINVNEGAAPEDMLSIRAWIEPGRVVTLRRRQSRSIKAIAADLDRGAGPTGVGELAVTLIERIVEHIAARVDTLGDDIAACEDQVVGETRGELRAQLADHRRRAIALRRFLAPQREAFGKLAQIQLPWLGATANSRIVEAADRMTRTVEELDAARDRAAVTQEELQSKVGEATNQRLYLLSVVTVVFLPLGFVCSLLGVNVGGGVGVGGVTLGASICCGCAVAPAGSWTFGGVSLDPEPGDIDGDDAWQPKTNSRTHSFANMYVFRTRMRSHAS